MSDTEPASIPNKVKYDLANPADSNYHMIAIGGHGMSVVAELLANRGAKVTGSDRDDTPTLRTLQGMGIDAYTPHGAKQFDADATVVISTAIRVDNIELVQAQSRGQRVIHRSQALALAAADQKFIAVAGTHGKTTSSAMIAVALMETGWDPSFAIGSSIAGVGTGARTGRDVFVAEADESDRSFLNYTPQIELVTNIEADHLDNFGSTDELIDLFADFATRIVPGGHLICCAEDPGSARLAQIVRSRGETSVWTYGRPELCEEKPDVELLNSEWDADSASAILRFGEQDYRLKLKVTGEHNLVNAAGAWASCVALGANARACADAMLEFKGTERRFEICGEEDGRVLIDDFAHHPTEVETALRQARTFAGKGKVIVVFQPHLFSRTGFFKERFAAALQLADHAVVADIDGAREDPIPGITSELIFESAPTDNNLIRGGTAEQAALRGANLTGPGDLCVLMGCGNIYLQENTVLQRWRDTPVQTVSTPKVD